MSALATALPGLHHLEDPTITSATADDKQLAPNPPPALLRKDRLAAATAAAVVLVVIVYIRSTVEPAQDIAWSYQVLTLCLVAAAMAGRALTGFRSHQATSDEPAGLARWAWLLVLLAASLPYLLTLRIGLLSDDYGLLAAARGSAGALQAMRSDAFVAFYRPLTLFVWWLGDRLWAGAPSGYHALSVGLHTLNALLVYRLGRRLIPTAYGALAAALLFALHPMHVETVTWLAASSDLFCTAFSLSSLLLLEHYLCLPSKAGRPAFLLGALLSFLLALLSKEAAFALPGFVVLRLALLNGTHPARRSLGIGGAYALVFVGYGVSRFLTLGEIGGYAMPLSFWNTYFPSAPLLMLGDFLFPVNRTLFSAELHPWTLWAAVGLMAAGALWWVRGLQHAPGRRLWLWLGFVFLMSVPTWLFLWRQSAATEWSRFAYLPTIGAAWLFGDLCAARGWRRSAPTAAAILAVAAALTIWYITPWRQAGRISSQVVAAGAKLVDRLSDDGEPPVLYVTDLPAAWRGAQVLAYSYPQALNLACGRPVPVRMVTSRPGAGGIHPDAMAAWKLKPGEHLISYDARARVMRIVRSGEATVFRDLSPETPEKEIAEP